MNKYSNLKVGETYKSYRQVCEVLGEKIEAGNSKKAQLKDWACYFNYEKQGNKFIVTELYDKPQEREDLRKEGRNSIYGEFVQLLILDYLALCNGHIIVGRQRLMQTIGMVNRDYTDCRNSQKKLSTYTEMDVKVIHDFYNTTNSNFKRAVESALDKLVNKRIIFYSKVIKVKKNEESFTSVATPFQLQKILIIEKEALEELGYNEISEVRNSSNWYNFNNKVRNRLKEELKIEYYFTAYDISINEEYLDSEKKKTIEYILEKAERDNSKESLNNLIIENVNDNAQKRSDNAFHASKYMSRVRSDENYVDNIIKLSKLLLNKKSSHIADRVKNIVIAEDLSSETQRQIDELF